MARTTAAGREPIARPERAIVLARGGVAGLFFLNALAYATVVPRLPGIKADLGLSNTALGSALAAMPAGALLSGLAAGWVIARIGSARLGVACGIGFGILLPGFALAPIVGGAGGGVPGPRCP